MAQIKSISYSVLSCDDICKSSEVQVRKSSTLGADLVPIENGLLDLRMGPASKEGQCMTCHARTTNCPGHFGCIDLILPVFHVGYFNHVLDILECICKSCSRILLTNEEQKEFRRKIRSPRVDSAGRMDVFQKIREKCQVAICHRSKEM